VGKHGDFMSGEITTTAALPGPEAHGGVMLVTVVIVN